VGGGVWGSWPQTDKNLSQSPFTGKFFRWRHFSLLLRVLSFFTEKSFADTQEHWKLFQQSWFTKCRFTNIFKWHFNTEKKTTDCRATVSQKFNRCFITKRLFQVQYVHGRQTIVVQSTFVQYIYKHRKLHIWMCINVTEVWHSFQIFFKYYFGGLCWPLLCFCRPFQIFFKKYVDWGFEPWELVVTRGRAINLATVLRTAVCHPFWFTRCKK
jgi:hypothetical protein